MAIEGTFHSTFIPEVWAAQLIVELKNALVYGQPGLVNRDYEGEIQNYGDTVRINTVTPPTVDDYALHTDITVAPVADTDRTLTIDTAKYFAFEIDDIETAQVRTNNFAQAAQDAAYALRDAADTYIAGGMVDGAGTALGQVQVNSATDLESLLIDMGVALDEANVPSEGRWVVVSPALHGLLLRSDLFVPVNTSGTSEALRNAQVGRAFGFDILKSNKTPDGADGGKMVIAGHRMGYSYAEQILKTEAFKMELRFNAALKGLHVYGGKVLRPEALVTADAQPTEVTS